MCYCVAKTSILRGRDRRGGGESEGVRVVPGSLAELDADSFLHAPIWGENGIAFFLIRH